MGISKKVFATAYRTQSDLGFDSTLPVDAFRSDRANVPTLLFHFPERASDKALTFALTFLDHEAKR